MREINCVLIRHGLTDGNIEKRYIGKATDEPLSETGIEELENKASCFAELDENCIVYTSPMRRCIQTAQILFPQHEYKPEPELCEIDFGSFEGKNYTELTDNEEYRKWIDSNGKLPFPNGESRADFITRCTRCFKRILTENMNDSRPLIFVVHGGTIMAVMSELSGEDYYSFRTQCGNGYTLRCKIEEGNIYEISYDCLFDRSDS